jgi:hypothetical protein
VLTVLEAIASGEGGGCGAEAAAEITHTIIRRSGMTSDPWGCPADMTAEAFQQWLERASVEDVEGFGATLVPSRYLSTSVLTSNINASMERVKTIMDQPSRLSRWRLRDDV